MMVAAGFLHLFACANMMFLFELMFVAACQIKYQNSSSSIAKTERLQREMCMRRLFCALHIGLASLTISCMLDAWICPLLLGTESSANLRCVARSYLLFASVAVFQQLCLECFWVVHDDWEAEKKQPLLSMERTDEEYKLGFFQKV